MSDQYEVDIEPIEVPADLIEAYMESDFKTPYKYEVEFSPTHAEIWHDSEGERYYSFFMDNKRQKSAHRKFSFTHEKHMTRKELLDYLRGSKGIKDVFGYKGENTERTKEELLDEIMNYF